jgi:hypothetical protein
MARPAERMPAKEKWKVETSLAAESIESSYLPLG